MIKAIIAIIPALLFSSASYAEEQPNIMAKLICTHDTDLQLIKYKNNAMALEIFENNVKKKTLYYTCLRQGNGFQETTYLDLHEAIDTNRVERPYKAVLTVSQGSTPTVLRDNKGTTFVCAHIL